MMLRSVWRQLQQQTSRLNRNSNTTSRDQHQHHQQPAYTLYHNYTSDIDIHSTPLDSPSQSTLTCDQVAGQGRHKVTTAGHPFTGKVTAAAILTSFLAGLVLGLITHSNYTVASPSSQGHWHSSANQVSYIIISFSLTVMIRTKPTRRKLHNSKVTVKHYQTSRIFNSHYA